MKSPTHIRITQHAAKTRKSEATAPPPSHFPYVTVLLVLILLGGLGFRMYGLSHGLAEIEVYHPDTSHVLSATRHFLEGTYFFRINNRDYDGYPYFYSHIVEYLWRGFRALRSGLMRVLLGAEYSGQPPTTLQLKVALFWLARLTNVVLSALTILVVFRIALRALSVTAGPIAAALLAFSPMNIATAHYAGSDTAVVFFTTLTILVAIRIHEGGLWRDYLLGGVLVACSFSAKYHAGIVGLTCLLAHALRYWPPKRLLGKEPFSRLILLAAAFIVTFLLANPAFLISPGKAFHDFREYCRYIPTAKLTAEQMSLGFFGKVWLSLKLNLPVLLRCMGPVLFVVSLAGMVHAFFQGRKLMVVASFPLLYLLLTFLSKPVQQRFYLAALFPTLFVLAAAFLVMICRVKKIKMATVTATVLILVIGGGYLLKSSFTEAYFFAHRDTRRCAKEWAAENIPSSYAVKPGPYTFTPAPPEEVHSSHEATVILKSGLRDVPLPQDAFLLKAFDLEEDALPKFRNPKIEIHPQASRLLSEGFSLPVYQRIPSQSRNEFLFAHGPTFYRDEKIIEFGAENAASKIIVSANSIDSAFVIVRNGTSPGTATIRLGGMKTTFFLEPAEVKWKAFRGLRKSFPSSRSRFFYNLSARGSVSKAHLQVAITPEEKGVALYNIGEYATARPFLALASNQSTSPALAAMAYISGTLSMSPPTEEEKALLDRASSLSDLLHPEAVQSTFSISLDYLDSLSYLSFKPCKNTSAGIHSVADSSASNDTAATLEAQPREPGMWRTGTPPLTLEPGCYVATVRIRCEPSPNRNATVTVRLMERRTRVTLAERKFPARDIPPMYTDLMFPFEKATEVGECWVVVSAADYVPLFIDRIDIRPDPLNTLAALQCLLTIVTSPPDRPPVVGPLDYKPLLLLANQYASENKSLQALKYYLLAHDLRPDLREPIRGLKRIQALNVALPPDDLAKANDIVSRADAQIASVETGETRAAFENGLELTGYAMSRGPFHPGDTFGLSLRWSVPPRKRTPKDLVVWVHLLGRDGAKLFQLDRYLLEDLAFPQEPDRIVPLLTRAQQIPLFTPPGEYRIVVGLWIPLRDWRPRITETTLPHTRDSLALGEISVESP